MFYKNMIQNNCLNIVNTKCFLLLHIEGWNQKGVSDISPTLQESQN